MAGYMYRMSGTERGDSRYAYTTSEREREMTDCIYTQRYCYKERWAGIEPKCQREREISRGRCRDD